MKNNTCSLSINILHMIEFEKGMIGKHQIERLESFEEQIDDFLHSGAVIACDSENLLVGWGRKEWLPSHSTDHEFSFYFPDFFLEAPLPWLVHENQGLITKNDLIKVLKKNSYCSSLKTQWQTSHKAYFGNTFSNLKTLFEQGTLQKAVPFVYESAECSFNQSRLANSLICALNYTDSTSAYVYGQWDTSNGILGATPELLFRKDAQDAYRIETVACAGTRKVELMSQETLMADPKEYREHQLVVEGIKESLQQFGDVTIGDLETIQLPTLIHLFTKIFVNTQREVSFEEVVRALHPTPALGAYPKEKGQQWLRDYEKNIKRHRFGAPVGFMTNDQNTETCYVAIRNVQWDSGHAYLCAGCGVVADSQKDKEWEEILLKLQAIKKILVL